MANKQYVLGRGELYFDAMTPNTTNKTGERFIGNVTAFSLTIESETLDHFDSTQGVREKDDSVLLQINRTGAMTTDNMDTENFALFILGATTTVTQANTPVIDEPINGVLVDRYYQLGVTTGNPSGVRGVSAVTVEDDATPTPATFVAGTDYVLDAALGRIYVKPGGAITAGTNLRVSYTPASNTRERIATGAGSKIDGGLRFVSQNPKGPVRDVYIPYCSLSPSGELPFIGDEWQAMTFNIDINKLEGVEAIYIDGRPA